MQAFTTVSAVAAPLDLPNIDTDRIIPARFLRKPKSPELADVLFRDVRFDADGNEREDFVLNQAPFRNAKVLVVAENFGCGSSREAAVWTLEAYGIRAVIAPSLGDIFHENCYKNGLLPVIVDTATHEVLLASPGMRVSIDLESCSLAFDDAQVSFPIDPFARRCLLEGVDELGFLLAQDDAIAVYEKEGGCAR